MKKIILFFMLLLLFSNCKTFQTNKESTIKEDYFGLHIHDAPNKEELWQKIKFKTIRIWDCEVIWSDLEKQKSKWDFSKLDKIVEYAEKNNIEILMTLGQTPGWASTKKNVFYPYGRKDILTSPPQNIEDWKNYITILGQRYKGKIKYWEVWNEPDSLFFYSGTIKELVNLTKEANVILKKIDVENKIVSPSVTGWIFYGFALGWLDLYLEGVKDYIDIIGFHYYTFEICQPETLIEYLSLLKNILKKYKISDKPFWNTEGSFFFSNKENVDQKKAISFMVRNYLIQKSFGVDRFYWYALDNEPYIGGMISKKSYQVLPLGKAYQFLEDLIIGGSVTKLEQISLDLWVCEISKNSQKLRVLWSTSGKIKFSIPDSWNVSEIISFDDKKLNLVNNVEIDILPIVFVCEK
ncbi:MAG: hypothetical protein A2086_12135 [Spirochaetes bacterium GWD1_27_9]|nr:MAG: hypothetical protein A2Y34_04025 [Spirochaetes bacterium GWC1_27_15]OHD28979.1 MAG: hypothetical protein A2086_12135 [Spirochaetes bacterium GWD1_27_9]